MLKQDSGSRCCHGCCPLGFVSLSVLARASHVHVYALEAMNPSCASRKLLLLHAVMKSKT